MEKLKSYRTQMRRQRWNRHRRWPCDTIRGQWPVKTTYLQKGKWPQYDDVKGIKLN